MKRSNLLKHFIFDLYCYVRLIVWVFIFSSALPFNFTQSVGATSIPPTPFGPIAVSINITSSSNTFSKPAETMQLTVNASMSDGTTEDITSSEKGTEYQSDDPSVVTVDSEGFVTAVGVGKAKVVVNIGLISDEIEIEVLNPLNEDCIASVLNLQTTIKENGTFAFNHPMPNGVYRVRVVCERETGVEFGQSDYLTPTPNGETTVGPVIFGNVDLIPVSLQLTSTSTSLTPSITTAQLSVTGTLSDNTTVDLTGSATGTFYTSTNPGIATVSAEGLVTGVTSGTVFITARNEGVVATIQTQVQLSGDSDNDGLPDDFEIANSFNPGGENLSLLAGTTANASTFQLGSEPNRVLDGDVSTSWVAQNGDTSESGSPFIEVVLPSPQNVSQVRLVGNRGVGAFVDSILKGTVEAFDDADTSIFNSGEVTFPEPTRDLSVPMDLNGVKRIRITVTGELFHPALAEFQIISRSGEGLVLDKDLASDANLDFDGDELTNLAEFNAGTSIFLADTDGDFINDNLESGLGVNSLSADSDNDGLLDGLELNPIQDFDNDGVNNILDPDSDNDGLPDGVEVALFLDPLNTDSDGDALPDGSEDTEGDGLPNSEELLENTDPANSDTDKDGSLDGEEVVAGADGNITDPLMADSDNDGMLDGFENFYGLDPNDPADASLDPDNDNLTNLQEAAVASDPFSSDDGPPMVVQVIPADNATNILSDTPVEIHLSEPLSPGSVTANTVTIFANGLDISGTPTLSPDGLTLTTPINFPVFVSFYRVRVQGVRIINESGNTQIGHFESSYFTSADGGD